MAQGRTSFFHIAAGVLLAGAVAFAAMTPLGASQASAPEESGVVEAPELSAVTPTPNTIADGATFQELLKELVAAYNKANSLTGSSAKTVRDITVLKGAVSQAYSGTPPTNGALIALDSMQQSTPSVWATLAMGSGKLTLTLETSGSKFVLAPNSEGMFAGLRGLKTIEIGAIPSGLTSGADNYINCVDRSDVVFDTSQVVYMGSFFEDCSSLQNLHLVDFDVSKVTDMHSMFEGCVKLEGLQLGSSSGSGGFVGQNVVRIDHFFQDCERLLAVGSDSTRQVAGYNTWMSDWAKYENDLASYNSNSSLSRPIEPKPRDYAKDCWNLRNWNVSSVKEMGQLFYNCEAMYNIDLSGWKFKDDWFPKTATTSGSTTTPAEDLMGIPAEDTPSGVSSSAVPTGSISTQYRVNVWYLFDGSGLAQVKLASGSPLGEGGTLYDMAAYPQDCEIV